MLELQPITIERRESTERPEEVKTTLAWEPTLALESDIFFLGGRGGEGGGGAETA